jgi:hypothetical protein
MLAILAKEQDLPINLLLNILAKRVNSRKLIVYSTAKTDVIIIDLRGRVKTQHILFVVADLNKYLLYLELL